MRDIKFRAWVGNLGSGEMVKVITLHFNHAGKCIGGDFYDGEIEFGDDLKKIILMQFTGLVGKGGKEIYEGDIVRWDDDSKGKYWRVAVVEWGNGELELRTVNNTLHPLSTREGYVFEFGSFIYNGDGHLEVVGNIYENPELTFNHGS